MDQTEIPARLRKREGIGARVLRKEDARHLAGKGNFVGDFVIPGMQEVAFLRSPLAHATITGVEFPEELTGQVFLREMMADAADIGSPSSLPTYQPSLLPPLASGKVRFVGEAVAMAIAPKRAVAEDLLEQVHVSYEELPVYHDSWSALAAEGELMHTGWKDNVFLTLRADRDFDELAAKAEVKVSRTIELSRQCIVPMEGKSVLAYWDFQADQLVVVSATQVPHLVRTGVAQHLHMPEEAVRVVSPDVGGGFGYKGMLYPEDLCIAWLAKTYRRPFRYLEDRREHLIVGANTRQHHYQVTAYADRTGKVLALDAVITIDGGAYSYWPFFIGLEPGQALGNLPGPYTFRGYRCETVCVATNKPGFMPYRGVARTGVCFAIELLMDALAREVGREPWQVRMENLVPADQMPYVNVANKHFDSGDFPKSLKRAVEMIGVEAVRERQSRGEPDGRRIGVGTATYTEQSAHGTSVFATWGLPVVPGHDQASVKLTADGGLEVRVGVHSHGQGMETTFAQIAHDVLGIPVERIRVVHGDTALTPFSSGTYASRATVMSGGAISTACKELLPRLQAIAGHLMGVEPQSVVLLEGRALAGGKSISLADVGRAWYLTPQELPSNVHLGGLEVSRAYKPKVDTGTFTYASHAAVVAVDTETGHVEILDYVVVEDCGTIVNPMIVEGQTIGGIAQGIGTAMYEESPYDDQGQPLASTLADYILPGATEVPRIRIDHLETPSPHTEFGAKGVGEGGAIAPPAVIFNAVNDALQGTGAAELLMTPLTPHRLLTALGASQREQEGTK
ncbi:Molybdopterin dehydrogenase, large subunit (plasmid) [Cupriavidus necator H850]|uniref:xanthine dehydrogenase family protein molybdopterin-binding subunit n=1 Tax=Cupriavidus necator TaxID=106590 RepID=UPI00129D8974|nr:xanthine dehydrogenase family protein molybdopterin-binding subunit [Cupriavidus necator]KAI3601388.1 Molybdopterin dehydrogenase, large subunit [Cupriavidus necator H850]